MIVTCRIYNLDLIEPRFYKVKPGITGVYISFVYLFLETDCATRSCQNHFNGLVVTSTQNIFFEKNETTKENIIIFHLNLKLSFYSCKIRSLYVALMTKSTKLPFSLVLDKLLAKRPVSIIVWV